MKMGRKALLVAAVLAASTALSTPALAATSSSFSDVPADHWAYEALDYLAANGVIEGYPDGSFQGGRAMSRYEMAAIVARACQQDGLGIGSKAVLEKLQAEYADELGIMKDRIEKNEKDISELKEQVGKVNFHGMLRVQYDSDQGDLANGNKNDNNRFYLDLRGDYKVNKNWTVKFQNESNRRYASDTSTSGSQGHNTDWWHQGTNSRIWVDGYDPVSGSWISIGRAWRGLGMQNLLQGGETDGIQAGTPIKGTGLTGSVFVMSPTSWGTKYKTVKNNDGTYTTTSYEDGANYRFYGAGFWGSLGHNFDVNCAYAHIQQGHGDNNGNWLGKNAYVLSAATNVLPNLRLTGDYIRMDRDAQNSSNNEWALKLQYKGSDLNKPGSFGIYSRYLHLTQRGIGGDDEWGSLKQNANTWALGFKYVLQKNVEWETAYFNSNGIYGDAGKNRRLLRTQIDFHF